MSHGQFRRLSLVSHAFCQHSVQSQHQSVLMCVNVCNSNSGVCDSHFMNCIHESSVKGQSVCCWRLNRKCSCILPLLSNKQNQSFYEMSMTFKLPKGILPIQLCSHVLCSNHILFFLFFSWKQTELQFEKVADWLREMWREGCVYERYIGKTVLELNILSSFPVWDLSQFIHQEPSSIISVRPLSDIPQECSPECGFESKNPPTVLSHLPLRIAKKRNEVWLRIAWKRREDTTRNIVTWMCVRRLCVCATARLPFNPECVAYPFTLSSQPACGERDTSIIDGQ